MWPNLQLLAGLRSGPCMEGRRGVHPLIQDTVTTHPHVAYCPDNSGPTDIWDLAYVTQKPKEIVRQFWMRFLFVKNKIPDCCDAEALAAFRFNCHDEGISNALAQRHVITFPELLYIVSRYCVMEDT